MKSEVKKMREQKGFAAFVEDMKQYVNFYAKVTRTVK